MKNENLIKTGINEETMSMISELSNDISIIESMAKSVENAIDDEFNYTKADVENLVSSLRRLIESANDKLEMIDNALSL